MFFIIYSIWGPAFWVAPGCLMLVGDGNWPYLEGNPGIKTHARNGPSQHRAQGGAQSGECGRLISLF